MSEIDKDQIITTANPHDDRDFFKKERFAYFPEIAPADLMDVDDPKPVWEGRFTDHDGMPFHVYTLGGWWLKEGPIGRVPKRLAWKDDQGNEHGHTISGDLMIVHADSKAAADELAKDGLLFTLEDMVSHVQAQEAIEKARGSGIVIASEIRGRRR